MSLLFSSGNVMSLLSYSESLDDPGFRGYGVCIQAEKVGTVNDLLMDEDGNFQYLVVKPRWKIGQPLLLPFNYFQLDDERQCFYTTALTKQVLFDLSGLSWMPESI